MLEVLYDIESHLSDLLRDSADSWNSLDVDYEPPRVERLWRTWGDFRVFLHRIHPCEKALLHPHPWPSAVRIVSGRYEMGIGAPVFGAAGLDRGLGGQIEEVAKSILVAGSCYEMIHPHGWHYVKPMGSPSLSLMVTGKPYHLQPYDHSEFGKAAELGPLTPEGKEQLVKDFRMSYGPYAMGTLRGLKPR